jgi:hypothetical protein
MKGPISMNDDSTLIGVGGAPNDGCTCGAARPERLTGDDPHLAGCPAGDRTRTLRGLGFKSNTLRGLGAVPNRETPSAPLCPGCTVKSDRISDDLACLFGMAVVVVHGAEAARGKLCTMHARLLKLLVDEIKGGPRRVGDGSSWED